MGLQRVVPVQETLGGEYRVMREKGGGCGPLGCGFDVGSGSNFSPAGFFVGGVEGKGRAEGGNHGRVEGVKRESFGLGWRGKTLGPRKWPAAA